MKVIIKEEEKQKLNEIQTKLDSFKPEVSADFSEQKRVVESGYRLMTRSIKQFDSASMIMVVAGMLKSGKSTLVDLLSRCELASPVGFGVDTTRRPALIRLSPDKNDHIGSIDIYNLPEQIETEIQPSDDTQTDNEGRLRKKRELMAERWLNILDDLRGLRDDNEHFEPQGHVALTPENLKMAVVDSEHGPGQTLLDGEPVLVVINIPHNASYPSRILEEAGCMLIDMPGLDSGNAKICERIGTYDSIIDECDMLLFVQSSVSPLNMSALTELKGIRAKRSSATYRVIQNRMEATHWKTKAAVDKAQEECADFAAKIFEVFNSDIKIDNVNLGMAYFSVFGADSDMAKRSLLITDKDVDLSRQLLNKASHYFEGFEEKLMQDLKDNSTQSRYIHCIQHLRHTVSEAKKSINETCSTLALTIKNVLLKEQRAAQDVLSEIQNTYLDRHFCTHGEIFEIDEKQIERIISHAEGTIDEKYKDSLLTKSSATGKELDEFLSDASSIILQHLQNWLSSVADLHCIREST